ncbi:MAG: efflux RND transporter periplasmic adaptor subunit [Acidobacteria bacterium]|jgi:cobalt-zinc-cadmium efflux system membrane fusion protein|nr:efflux RND transporter periplasmic adaptor subunit [Acidobacteriota bacterium]
MFAHPAVLPFVVTRAARRPARSLAPAALALAATIACSAPAPPPAADPAPAATPSSTTGVVTLDDAARKKAGIDVVTVRTVAIGERLSVNGVVALDDALTARVGAIAEGLVADVLVGVGDPVRRGQAIARIHSHLVHDAKAAYRAADAGIRQAERDLAFARDAKSRADRLLAQKATSAQDVERSSTALVHAEQQLAIATSERRRAEEDLQHYGLSADDAAIGSERDQLVVRAPMAGSIFERHVTAGTAVTVGTPLFVIGDLSRVWILADVDEALLPHVSKGQRVTVRAAALPGIELPATITHVGDRVNPTTRRLTVRCVVANPGGRLKAEMFASVDLGAAEARPTIVVPATALQDLDGKTVVFVESTPGTFQARTVKVGAERDGQVAILEGLADGARVVSTGSFLLKSELLGTDDDS